MPVSTIIGSGIIDGNPVGGDTPLSSGVYFASIADVGNLPPPYVGGDWALTTNLSDGSEGDTGTRETASGATIGVLHVLASPEEWSEWKQTTKAKGTIDQGFYYWDSVGSQWVEIADLNAARWITRLAYVDQTRTAVLVPTTAAIFMTFMTESDTGSGNMSCSDSRKDGLFVSPNGSKYFRNDPGILYKESTFTTPATADADPIGGWKNDAGTPVSATQATSGQRPELELVDADFDSHSSAILVDSQTSPTVVKGVKVASFFTSGMNTAGFQCFAQVSRPASQNSTNCYFAEDGSPHFRVEIASSSRVRAVSTWIGNGEISFPNPDRGVLGCRWDGRFFSVLFNGQEIGVETGGSDTGLSVGGTLRVGGYDSSDTGYAGRRVGKWSALNPTLLDSDQCFAEVVALGIDMGLPNGGVGWRRIVFPGNSLYEGWAPSGYTNPMPTQLMALLGSDYKGNNLGSAGQPTSVIAANMVNTSTGAIAMGTSLKSKEYTIVTPFPSSRTAISIATTPWASNEFAGWTLVMMDGVNAGMGGVVASNTSSQITLTSPGLPVSPAAGDKFRLFKPMTQREHLIAVPYEITNRSFADADLYGITAAGGNWDDCLIWQEFRCFCIAMKAYGFRLIGMTNTDRTEVGRDANYDTDEPLYNARILANAEGLFDEVYDAYTALGANSGTGNFCDLVHWSNTGAGVIAAGLEAVIEGMFP